MGSHHPAATTSPPGKGFALALAVTGVLSAVGVVWVSHALEGIEALLTYARVAFVAPVAGWLLTLFLGPKLPGKGQAIATAAVLVSLIASAALFKGVVVDSYHPGFAIEHRFTWFDVPNMEVVRSLDAHAAASGTANGFWSLLANASSGFIGGVFVDNVTAVVLLMVTLLAFLIHVFATGYMQGDARYSRFMATMNLFAAGMIGLVIANNLLWVFACWELMGLCSFLLIGHYQEKNSAASASLKAFFTTRLADAFMFVGMLMLFAAAGTFAWAGGDDVLMGMAQGSYTGPVELAGRGSLFDGAAHSVLGLGGIAATMLGLLLAIGPFGKSAQFPFQGWLPDAMEGPTPVSAMIHAACMVSAGVLLTARLFPLFTPDVLQVIALVGAGTALGAGVMGLVQRDIKKVLAYSTMSQLGYMFMGLGVGAWQPALFHMLTHAFFKALLFLGAGSVIHGCHHEQDMGRMGGLWRKMPVTMTTFWIGTLSLVGLPYFFAGYYSKEAILLDARLFAGLGGGVLPYIFGIAGAGLTALYMLRLMWLVFHGKPRDQSLWQQVKESPQVMVLPLVLIAIGTFAVSWPIGSAKSSENLGITNIARISVEGPRDQFEPDSAQVFGPRPAQQPDESWLQYLWRKPASAWSAEANAASAALVAPGVSDAVFADTRGRPGFDNIQPWTQDDIVMDDSLRGPWAGIAGLRHKAHASVFLRSLAAMLGGIGLSILLCWPALRRGGAPGIAQPREFERARTWLELLVTDGPSRTVATLTRGVMRFIAVFDYLGIDAPVRGLARGSLFVGDGVSHSVTGRVQDYVFLLVGLLMLFFALVMLM